MFYSEFFTEIGYFRFPLFAMKSFFMLICVFVPLIGCKTPVKLPEVISAKPQLEELVKAVNGNSEKIQTLRSDNVIFGTGGIVGWGTCRIAFQRPNRLRAIASVTMAGNVLDCGCNDELFWYWSKYDNPPQLVWANKKDLTDAASPANTIPLEPTWISSALGIVEINMNDVTEGPLPQADGSFLVITKVQRPDGLYSKHHYILPKSAAVKRQEIFDSYGNQIIMVNCEEFQVKKASADQDVVLPKRLVITTPMQKESFHLDFGDLSLNGPNDIKENLFVMPKPEDLGSPPTVNLKDIKRNQVPIPTKSSDSGYIQTRNTAPTATPSQTVPPVTGGIVSNSGTASGSASNAPKNTFSSGSAMSAAPLNGSFADQPNQQFSVQTSQNINSGEVSAHYRTQVLE